MTPEPLEFEPTRALEAISRFGLHHVSKDTPRSLLDPFMEEYGLSLQEGAFFTVTLVPSGTQNGGRSPEEWEAIRQENLKRRQKAAAAKKRRQA